VCLQEPLAQCYQYLRQKAVNMQLTERWTQECQILPGRTHPAMMMDSAAGYVLSGIAVDTTNPPGGSKRPPGRHGGGKRTKRTRR